MESLEHLNPKKIGKVAGRLSVASSSLNGLGSLFYFQSRESCMDQSEFAGIGYLLQEIAGEISRVEDILRCGYDSTAKRELETDYSEDD